MNEILCLSLGQNLTWSKFSASYWIGGTQQKEQDCQQNKELFQQPGTTSQIVRWEDNTAENTVKIISSKKKMKENDDFPRENEYVFLHNQELLFWVVFFQQKICFGDNLLHVIISISCKFFSHLKNDHKNM